MVKRIRSAFLVFVLVFGTITMNASAEGTEANSPVLYNVGDTIVSESEPNDLMSNADMLYDDYTATGMLPSGDMDVYKIVLKTMREFSIISAAMDENTIFALFDSEGNYLVESEYTDCQDGIYVQSISGLLEEGTYYIAIMNGADIEDEYLLYYISEKHQHSHDELVETIEPTCGERGYHVWRCYCGYLDNEYIPATEDHAYTPYVSDNNGNPDRQGTKSRQCTVCGCGMSVYDEGVYLHDVIMQTPTPHLTGNIIRWEEHEGADLYQVYRLNGSLWELLANTRGTAYKDETAPAGVKSYYKVRARNGNLMSSMAITSVSVTRPTLDNVTITSITPHLTGNIIYWDAVASAQFYQVYRLNGSSWELLTNTGGTAYKDETAAVGVKSYYKIVARNGNYKSDIASTNSMSAVRPAPVSQLDVVTITEVVGHRTGNIIRWNAVDNAVLYQVYRLNGSSWELLTNTGGLAYKDETAGVGVRTYYKIVARNGNTASDITKTKSVFGERL